MKMHNDNYSVILFILCILLLGIGGFIDDIVSLIRLSTSAIISMGAAIFFRIKD